MACAARLLQLARKLNIDVKKTSGLNGLCGQAIATRLPIPENLDLPSLNGLCGQAIATATRILPMYSATCKRSAPMCTARQSKRETSGLLPS